MSEAIANQSSFIIIGAWNPAIIEPSWLKREFPDLIPDKFQVILGSNMSFQLELDKIFLDPNGGRLVFTPKVLNDDTLDYIAKLSRGIQSRLQHTPVVAAGSNFFYKLTQNESFTIGKSEDPEKVLQRYDDLKGYSSISNTMRYTFSTDDNQVTVVCELKGNEKTLQINYEYKSPLDAMTMATEALIKNFQHAQALSKKLILQAT